MSLTGVYHVMLRGVNKQRIFEWQEDYESFLKILGKSMLTNTDGEAVEKPNYELYAYCLMDNHVHLLVHVTRQPLATVVKRIATSYAMYFNLRYHRVGHLFQDRFRSEPCENAEYLLTLMDYIHNNPVKGGCCVSPIDYKYCSYSELLKKSPDLCVIPEDFPGLDKRTVKTWLREMPLVDRGTVESVGGEKASDDRAMAEAARSERSIALMCNVGERSEEVDKMIVEALLAYGGCGSITEFQQLEKKAMRSALARVRDQGVSIRRLSRLSGISEGIIRYSKNPDNLLKEKAPAEEEA